jgi:LPXTG-motif cell wall-anchored protein
MISTAVLYLELGARGLVRSSHFNQSGVVQHHIEKNDRESGGPRIPGGQNIFFIIVGIASILVAVWMLKNKRKSKIPYIIAVVGSSGIIILYLITRTVNIPYLGLEAEVNTIDLLSKVLQVGIIIGSAIVIRQQQKEQQLKLYT